MFCGNCGTQIDDTAAFCPNCGAPVGTAPRPGTNSTAPAPGNSTFAARRQKKAPALPVAAVVVIAILLFLFGPFGGRSAEKTVNQFFTAVQESDVSGVMDLLPPNLLKNAMKQEGIDMDDYEEEIEYLEQQLERSMSLVGAFAGDDWSLETETLSTTDVTGDALKELKQEYQDYDVKISAAKSVSVRLTLVGGNGKEIQDTTTQVGVVKVGKNWYLDVNSMGSLF